MKSRASTLCVRRFIATAALLCAGATPAYGQHSRVHTPKRFGDTPLVRAWEQQYDCPASASRLPPIRVQPDSDFSRAEACAVVSRARDAWSRATYLYGTRIDPRDSMPITRVVVSHYIDDYIDASHPKPVRRDKGYSITFYRGGATAVIVAFAQNTDAEIVGPGHPDPGDLELPRRKP